MYEIQPASLHPSQRKLIAQPVGIHWFKWQAATGIVTFVFGERMLAFDLSVAVTTYCLWLVILQLRLLALYNLNRKILALMACTFVLALVGTSTILGVALSQVTGNIRGYPRCLVSFSDLHTGPLIQFIDINLCRHQPRCHIISVYILDTDDGLGECALCSRHGSCI